ncbi:hypothetical protein CEXT_227401 [Caerostris extrusa]|uniref:Uncharacterized protein n=1 Tax=Caerostris extrusa TaxID=172846 RepID=A0AAV4NQM4_CAEEX|nr:hypothetical protein CEXT_227401 [Caerostris extrusa]
MVHQHVCPFSQRRSLCKWTDIEIVALLYKKIIKRRDLFSEEKSSSLDTKGPCVCTKSTKKRKMGGVYHNVVLMAQEKEKITEGFITWSWCSGCSALPRTAPGRPSGVRRTATQKTSKASR